MSQVAIAHFDQRDRGQFLVYLVPGTRDWFDIDVIFEYLNIGSAGRADPAWLDSIEPQVKVDTF